jgi:hypothetical protein
MVIPADFSSSGKFINGYAMVEQGSQYVYIDRKGEIILRFNK